MRILSNLEFSILKRSTQFGRGAHRMLGLCGRQHSRGSPPFVKTKDVAQQISLEHDLKSSDLFRIIHVIAEKARKLAD
jgi:hypothetical protein